MRMFKIYLNDECLCEMTTANLRITIADCLGEDRVDDVLHKLSEGDSVFLRDNWTVKEKTA